MDKKYTLDEFVEIMKTLTGENGCPWDKEQTHDSLKRYLIEECYEVIDAINNKDKDNLCEELGDVLLQVVFHSVLAEKAGGFNLQDVITGVSEKMINRHPHIFGNATADTSQEVLQNWESIKKEEKGYASYSDAINKIPKSLPSIIRAEKVLKKSVNSNIIHGSLDENIDFFIETSKMLEMVKKGNLDNKEEIIGVLFLSLINISRFLQINADFSLTNASETFINKFEYIENMSAAVGKINEDTDLEDVDIFKNLLGG